MTEQWSMSEHKFPLGQVVATPAAVAILEQGNMGPDTLLIRHARLHSPELCEEDKQANREAVECGDRVVSSYTVAGTKLFVITEWDRSVTTILLADEY
jgi:hypothetical protein